jgi:hypothetical protein
VSEREGMDPRPTEPELAEWTASVACAEALSQVDTLRLLQEVRRLGQKLKALSNAANWVSDCWGRKEDTWIRVDMDEAVNVMRERMRDE